VITDNQLINVILKGNIQFFTAICNFVISLSYDMEINVAISLSYYVFNLLRAVNERSDSNDVTGHANNSLINVSFEVNNPFCITVIVSQCIPL
jgi:hypothetical protein